MFERYSEGARRLLFFARYEASEYGATAIESEHLLLGLLRVTASNADLRHRLGLDANRLRDAVQTRTAPRPRVSTSVEMPFGESAKRALAHAAAEAAAAGSPSIEVDHHLLALARSTGSLAAAALAEAGVTYDEARARLALPDAGSSDGIPTIRSLVSRLATADTVDERHVLHEQIMLALDELDRRQGG